MSDDQPLLTVCTPTFERPELLRRAIGSVIAQVDPRMSQVELVVADNSTGDEPEEIARSLLATWPGPTHYVRNRPSVGMIGNHNRCIELATGRYIAFLHDDDALVPGGIGMVLDAVSPPGAAAVHLFGVDVVRIDGSLRRRQRPRRDEQLDPPRALRRLLTDSSFVRLPGLIASADAYRAAGPFNEDAGNAIDLDMWVRLFARHGLHTVPHVLAAYTVHEAALTSGMFTPETVDRLMRIFDRAAGLGVLTPREVRRGQSRWFHKFILAGAYRSLEARDRAAAAEILRLFRLREIRRLGPSARWLPARLAFTVATLGARPRRAADGRPEASP
jgi:glycosyltransferase involved in cell wall biosynthesis